jgi:hypothetical protein
MTIKQFPYKWMSAAFRPLGGYWIARQGGQFPNKSQGSIEQIYQKWLLVHLPQNTPRNK